MPLQTVTIDMTVARDFIDGRRLRHALAVELFRLHRERSIELALAPQGHRSDLSPGPVTRKLYAAMEEQGVAELPQVARLSSVTLPSTTLLPGAYVKGFSEARTQVLSTWKTHEGAPPGSSDYWHVETHLLWKRDVFITDDRALRNMCHRLRAEYDLQIVAVSLSDYMESRGASRQ